MKGLDRLLTFYTIYVYLSNDEVLRFFEAFGDSHTDGGPAILRTLPSQLEKWYDDICRLL